MAGVCAGCEGSVRVGQEEENAVPEPGGVNRREVGPAAVHSAYLRWGIEVEARRALSQIANGETTFKELASLAPYLVDHPAIQKAAAMAAFAGKIPVRRGRAKGEQTQPEAVQDLIAWTRFYCGMDKLTIEAAVAKALQHHQHLVPTQWKEPEDALKKAYGRHFKKRS